MKKQPVEIKGIGVIVQVMAALEGEKREEEVEEIRRQLQKQKEQIVDSGNSLAW